MSIAEEILNNSSTPDELISKAKELSLSDVNNHDEPNIMGWLFRDESQLYYDVNQRKAVSILLDGDNFERDERYFFG